MEEFAIVRHSLNNENSFNEERIKMFFLIFWFTDSSSDLLKLKFFDTKRGNGIRPSWILESFSPSIALAQIFASERNSLGWVGRSIRKEERKKKKKRSISCVSRNCKATGLLPRKELRVEDGKTMEKGRSRKKYILLEKFLSNGCWSRSTTPYSMKENGFRRLTVDDSRHLSRTLGNKCIVCT